MKTTETKLIPTPGPWSYRRTYHLGEEVGCAIMPMGYDISTSNLDENEANARLIVAAPLMYAALLDVQRALACYRDNEPNVHPVHGLISLEEVKYLIVDPAIAQSRA